MPRIAKRLAGPAQVSNAAATKYTVPALTKTIVRHIHVQNPSASAVTFTMSIGADAAATRLFDAYSIGAGQVLDHFCYYVIDVAEIIQAFAGTNNILVLTIDGDESILG
jgi:predicted amidohydrolase